jgi:hypothetical protein
MFEEGNSLSLARTLESICGMPMEDRRALSARMRKIAVERYSLSGVILRVLDALKMI